MVQTPRMRAKSGTRLVLAMVAVAAAIGAWARFHTRSQAPIDLEPGRTAHIRITKKVSLTLKGGFTAGGVLDLELAAGDRVTVLAKDWKGAPVDVDIPDGGGMIQLTYRAGSGVENVKGKMEWSKRGP
ncbi:MAG: hypothetical protein HYY18_08225 [Planctomycetes bacterium]|nr:hypothetical protein [Planctomycetota bacterium]